MNDREVIELLEQMVRIESISGDEAAVASFLAERMNQVGFEAGVDAAGNVVGTIGRGALEGVLLGHIDTVPGRVPVRIEDGRLYGRGAVDAKGPFAAFVAAAARLDAAALDRVRLTVIGCVEEEAPSSKGAHHVKNRYRPDFLIVGEPSGWDAMTLGYKGCLRADVTLRGEAAHSAHEQPTIAERACRVWRRIELGARRFDRGRERLFDRLLVTLSSLRTESDGRYETARLALTMRLPPDLDPRAARAWLDEHLGAGAEVDVLGIAPAWSGPRTTPLHRALSRGIAAVGGRARYLLKTGTADLNVLAPRWGCPALAYGPGDAALDHTPDEHIVLDDLLRGVRVLEQTLSAAPAIFQSASAPARSHR